MSVCLLGLGANLDDRQQQLDAAVGQLAEHPAVSVRAVSRWRVTPPIGGPPGTADYLNGAALIDTRLSVTELFEVIRSIERGLGRRRRQRWDARRIDIDILLFDDLVCHTQDLQVPHPWMAVRRFVLEPAAEIAPEFPHPMVGWTVGQLAKHLMAEPLRFALCGSTDPEHFAELARNAGAHPVDDPLVDRERTTRPESTRPNYGQQIEFLHRRQRSLFESEWREPVQAVISRFWLEESRLVAGASLSGAERQAFEAEFEARTASIPPPKLLIIWLAQGVPRSAEQVRLSRNDFRQMVMQQVKSLSLFHSL
jgi:2-amino-4-hydroxy-6-hydroxymethyldihydropteridine diphosphokinase